jgi:hypothetical protein
VALKKKKVEAPQGKPVVSRIPIPVSDTALVIDLPDGQKLVVGNMTHGTVIEVATWRGTGRPDSRTNRMMLGMTNAELEETLQEENAEPTKVEASFTLAQQILNPVVAGFKWLFNFKDYDVKGMAKTLKSLRESEKTKPVVIEEELTVDPVQIVPVTPITPAAPTTPLPPVKPVIPVESAISPELPTIKSEPKAKFSKIKISIPKLPKLPKLPKISAPSKLSKSHKPSFIASSIASITPISKSSKSEEADIEAWLDNLMAKSNTSKPSAVSRSTITNITPKSTTKKKSNAKKAAVNTKKAKPKR